MSLELKGIIKEIGEVQTFNEGTFKKRQVLITIEPGDFEQHIPVDASQKHLELFDACGVGDKVTVDINLRSNEHNGKHYPSISGWRLSINEKGTGIPDSELATDPVDGNASDQNDLDVALGGGDDLDF